MFYKDLWLVRTLISRGNSVGSKVRSLIFPSFRILENPDLFTNLVLDNLVQICGEDNRKTFEAVRFMAPTFPKNYLKKISKFFFGRIDTFFGNKEKDVKIGTIFLQYILF